MAVEGRAYTMVRTPLQAALSRTQKRARRERRAM